MRILLSLISVFTLASCSQIMNAERKPEPPPSNSSEKPWNQMQQFETRGPMGMFDPR